MFHGIARGQAPTIGQQCVRDGLGFGDGFALPGGIGRRHPVAGCLPHSAVQVGMLRQRADVDAETLGHPRHRLTLLNGSFQRSLDGRVVRRSYRALCTPRRHRRAALVGDFQAALEQRCQTEGLCPTDVEDLIERQPRAGLLEPSRQNRNGRSRP